MFQFYQLFLGNSSAMKFFETVGRPSVIPILRIFGATIGKNCDVETGLSFHNCNDFRNLTIGNNCHIGKNCFFDLRGEITIENNVVISMKVTIITHQDINKSELSLLYSESVGGVSIGNNCYIGVNSTILKNVRINNASIVAACSLVLSNIPTSKLYGGVPAKFIKNIQ